MANVVRPSPSRQDSTPDYDQDVDGTSRAERPTNPEVEKILRNSLYLTFNAPQVDEYHRGIFLTHPPILALPDPGVSGTLFHASYTEESGWVLDQRQVKDVTSSHTLVLLYLVATFQQDEVDEVCERVHMVLNSVPLGKEDRERELGPKKGNPALGGYDCVVWTVDALAALDKAGLIDLGGKTADQVMAEARVIAGPEDAKIMVGVDFGGFKVIN